jgi:NAD+ diphosphatase
VPGAGWPRPIPYAGGHLDRAGAQRHDDAWVAAMRAHPATRVTPVWRDRSLVLDAAGPTPAAGLCAAAAWSALAPDSAEPWTLLGLDEAGPVFVADASALDEGSAACAAGTTFVDLPKVAALLGAADASLLAYARAMTYWHRRSRHCGVCGAPTESRLAGHMRRCTNPACGTETYPRTDPAVIMLVERPASAAAPRRCLLGRRPSTTSRMWSTLAGFMEPGETLEETVARETFEEAGVRVRAVAYQGSQPWPFPASLMVGFRAVGESDDIVVDPHELADARWFSAAELATFGEAGDADAERWLPGRSSIARALLEAWLAEVRGA